VKRFPRAETRRTKQLKAVQSMTWKSSHDNLNACIVLSFEEEIWGTLWWHRVPDEMLWIEGMRNGNSVIYGHTKPPLVDNLRFIHCSFVYWIVQQALVDSRRGT
jgi:hypothetical protein